MLKSLYSFKIVILFALVFVFSILIPTEVFAAIEVHYNYYPAPDISIKSYSGTSVTIRLPKYSSIGMRRGGSSGEDDDDNWISIFLYDDTGRLVSSGYIAVWSDKEMNIHLIVLMSIERIRSRPDMEKYMR